MTTVSTSYQAVHQMIYHQIIPSQDGFSTENTRFHHAGPQPTASLNKRLDLKKLMKASIYQCLTCYKLKAQATQQLMGS